MIFAIDPGNIESAFCVYYPNEEVKIGNHGKAENSFIVNVIKCYSGLQECVFVIEKIACMGMPVGKDIFDTCEWTGEFKRVIKDSGKEVNFVLRREVKHFLCGSMKAKDSNIRQAIIDLFPPSGGGKVPQIGVKKNPGQLYGVKADVWAALGVAITFDGMKN